MYIYKKKKYQFVMAVAAVLFIASSCTKKFDSINKPWDGSPTATVQQLYDGFVSNLQLQDEQVTHNSWTSAITQQGIVYTKPDYAYGNDGGELWSKFYHNLSNYNSLLNVIRSSTDSSIYTNVIAMAKTLKAYQAIRLSNFYGDIPFSNAGLAINGSPSSYTPAYDKQQDVYLACLADLKWAIDNFKLNDPKQFSLGAADFVLQNDIAKWIEFANSFRLRIALTMYDKDNADASAAIAEALTKPLLDADGTNVGLYPANIPNMDLGARKYSFGTECRLRMGTTMWQLMSANNNVDGSGIFDPRCSVYFEPNGAGKWIPFPQNPTTSTPAEGGDPYNSGNRDHDWANKNGNNGTVNMYANFNYYWARDESIPELFMTAAEVHFLKAELYNRGIGGVTANPATAQAEYKNGITTSIDFWVNMAINSPIWVVNKPTGLPSEATLNKMLAEPVVAYDVANNNNALKQIYAQEWIDMFRQSWEAWTLLKRTGLTPMDATNSGYYTQTYGMFNRYQYPSSEQTYNYANWHAETGGQDNTATKIWIEK